MRGPGNGVGAWERGEGSGMEWGPGNGVGTWEWGEGLGEGWMSGTDQVPVCWVAFQGGGQ